MEKRLFLALGLSLLILVTWSTWVNKTQHPGRQRVTVSEHPQPLPKEISLSSTAEIPILPEPLFDLPLQDKTFTFGESTGALKDVTFKNYKNSKLPLVNGLGLSGEFKREASAPGTLFFVSSAAAPKITKRFTFNNTNNTIELEIRALNHTSQPLKIKLPIVLGNISYLPSNPDARYQDLTIAATDRTQHLTPKQDAEFSGLKFLSLRDRYFCAIIEPQQKSYKAFIKKLNKQEYAVGVESEEMSIPPGGQIGHLFRLYIGPQDIKLLSSIKPDWTSVIHYGTFDFFAQLIWQLLDFMHRLVNSWGWAIILLSIAVYLILFPLSVKQLRSMKEMQALQPKIEALRVQYKDNPQKMNKEVMGLYREHKVNPLGGCLPLVLQMPIFFALYQVLMRSAALRGANFLWIKDLSEPDRLFILPKSLPILGNEVNILPIIMAIGMFVQQKMSTGKSSGTAAEQQKMMLIIMPIMFGLIFYRMPAGLVLYWFINSALMLVFQLKISRAR